MGKHYGLDIPTLRELLIDVDKEWLDQHGQARGITMLKEVAAAMAKGDLPVRGSSVLVKLTPGPISYILTSAGPGHIPVWLPAPGPLELYLPAAIELTHSEQIVTVDQSHNKNAPITSEHKQAYLDAPGDMIKRLTPTIALVDGQAIVTVDKSHNKNAPIATEGGVWVTPAVGGAILDDAGVQTDFTTEINNATANDVELLPPAPLEVGDWTAFGLGQLWDQLWLNIGTAGEGNWVLTEEYWDGAAWSALTLLKDNTNQFMAVGKNNVKWVRPGDWALTTILGMNLYWMRFRVTSVVSYTTQPLGTQGWCEVLA